MDRTFTTATHGPTSLRLQAGAARATVDPHAKTATITLHTDDPDGPAVDAIQKATASTANGLTVTVPDIAGPHGTHTVIHHGRGARSYSTFSTGNVVMSGGRITVNGRDITNDPTGAVHTSGITAQITLPPGAILVFNSVSADLTVTGPLAGLSTQTISGDLEAGVVGTIRASSTSGDIDLTAVTQQADLQTVSGDIEIGTYNGQQARLQAVSGDIALSATPTATGALSATTVSGNVRLRGAAHLNPHTSTVSGRVRT